MEVGSIVECINDNWDYHRSKIKMPVKGRLYTVKGFCHWPKGAGIFIEECNDIINVVDSSAGIDYGLHKAPFLKSRFVERLPPVKIVVEEIILEKV